MSRTMRLIAYMMLLLVGAASAGEVEYGKASWYSVRTNGGTRTASGQKLKNESHTAAHKKLKFGTKVKVTNLSNNKSVVVVINNRGPYIRGRVIDVTVGVAKELDFHNKGVTKVKLEIL